MTQSLWEILTLLLLVGIGIVCFVTMAKLFTVLLKMVLNLCSVAWYLLASSISVLALLTLGTIFAGTMIMTWQIWSVGTSERAKFFNPSSECRYYIVVQYPLSGKVAVFPNLDSLKEPRSTDLPLIVETLQCTLLTNSINNPTET